MPGRTPPSAILAFHSLDRTGRMLSTTPETFRRQTHALLDAGIKPVPLDQVRIVPGSVSLTFDDGYRNFVEHALPVLVEHRLPATLFVVSGLCGRSKSWPSRGPSSPEDALTSWAELRQVASAGIAIGAHSVSHPRLTALSESDAVREMRDSRAAIEDRLGRSVPWFAWPYGHSSPRLRELAAREFQLACGADLALVGEHTDPYDLPRIFDFYLRSPFWLRRLLRPSGHGYLAARRWLSKARAQLRREPG